MRRADFNLGHDRAMFEVLTRRRNSWRICAVVDRALGPKAVAEEAISFLGLAHDQRFLVRYALGGGITEYVVNSTPHAVRVIG